MRIEQKKAITEEIASRVRGADILYLTDFTGLDVAAMTELRDRLVESGAEYRVVKNTLTRRALEGLDLPDLSEWLEGPTGLILATEDPVRPAKVIREFARDHENRPVVKVGVVDRRTVTSAEIERLADLPPLETLLAHLAGALEAPLAALAGALEAKLREAVGLLDALRAKQEDAGA
jgi:large subunit ribosomal protein L10